MKITLEAGDRITIPKVCTAIIRGNHILIKKKGWEFENGNILTAISMFSYNCPFIFKGVDDKGFYTFYAGRESVVENIPELEWTETTYNLEDYFLSRNNGWNYSIVFRGGAFELHCNSNFIEQFISLTAAKQAANKDYKKLIKQVLGL